MNWAHIGGASTKNKVKSESNKQWRSQGGGATGHLPPPLGLRQTLGRECTYQADQGENGNLQ